MKINLNFITIFFLFFHNISALEKITFAPNIVGGSTISYSLSPSIVSIQVRGYHFCGGTALSQRYVLSAAHCALLYETSDYSVQIGSAILYQGGVNVNVSRIYKHPKFNTENVDYDYAIFYLESITNYPENVVFVKLPDMPTDNLKTGEEMYVMGWGNTLVEEDDRRFLRRAVVPIVDIPTCKKNYSWAQITLRMVCAGYTNGGIDSCDGELEKLKKK
jgi:secreted trypsin-like serine protease